MVTAFFFLITILSNYSGTMDTASIYCKFKSFLTCQNYFEKCKQSKTGGCTFSYVLCIRNMKKEMKIFIFKDERKLLFIACFYYAILSLMFIVLFYIQLPNHT